jgi:hypothetical protein
VGVFRTIAPTSQASTNVSEQPWRRRAELWRRRVSRFGCPKGPAAADAPPRRNPSVRLSSRGGAQRIQILPLPSLQEVTAWELSPRRWSAPSFVVGAFFRQVDGGGGGGRRRDLEGPFKARRGCVVARCLGGSDGFPLGGGGGEFKKLRRQLRSESN